MSFKKKTHQKIISFLIIISLLVPTILLSKPKQTNAFLGFGDIVTDPITNIQTTATVGNLVKSALKTIAKQVLMATAKKLLQKMTESTVTWINTGFHGRPLFLENTESFFRDVGKFAMRNTVDMIGYDSLNFPFGRDTAIGLINSYKRQFEKNAQYSLSKVTNDPTLLTQYRDFNYGGWNGFLATTQYKQNSPYGFRILVKENLASQLEGTLVSPAQKIKEDLQQGMGFLSPKTCLSNDKYNNGLNEFQKPTYKPTKYTKPFGLSGEALKMYRGGYELQEAEAKEKWENDNGCTKFASTTPGSVVANQITTALGSNFRQSELGAAFGNSLSAVFDSLLNHFMKEGLNSLATKINSRINPDNWDYEGNELGVEGSQGQFIGAWNTGPDQIIDVREFKDAIEQGTKDTREEIQIMDDISNLLGATWPESRKLDICQPGPDLNWQERLDKEKDRNGLKIQEQTSNSDGNKAANAQLAFNELKFATNSLQDWINNEMLKSLEHSLTYLDAIDEVSTLSQQSYELTTKRRAKIQALGRLGAIKEVLSKIPNNPEPESDDEKTLIKLKKQYDAISGSISYTASIEESRNELETSNDRYKNLTRLVTQCTSERLIKYRNNPTIQEIKLDSKNVPMSFSGTAEQSEFCDLPIKGGYSHETFVNPNLIPSYDIPMVNASNVNGTIDVKINCNIIYKANILDYKGNLPNATTFTEPNYNTNGGTCTYIDKTTSQTVTSQDLGQNDCFEKGGTWNSSTAAKTNTATESTPSPSNPLTLSVPTTATGTFSALSYITLTAKIDPVNMGAGPYKYLFYCNRPESDTPYHSPRGFIGDTGASFGFNLPTSPTATCSYQTGTYTPKVIFENTDGTKWYQANTTIKVD